MAALQRALRLPGPGHPIAEYFVDVTHSEASKGHVVKYLSARTNIPTSEIATIGDMHNDLSMFAVSGLSIAMGNADDEVQAAASEVTTSNDDEGFAHAVTRFFVLPQSS